jgi:predicted DNA-binding transcriptional regulator YafY
VVSLGDLERIALRVAEDALRVSGAAPLAAALRSAMEKLMPLLTMPGSLELPEESLPWFAGPPARTVPPGQFERLLVACQARRRLEITCPGIEGGPGVTHTVDPYRLILCGGEPYLVAVERSTGNYTVFALGEQMQKIHETGETFAADPAFNVDRLLISGLETFRTGSPVTDARRTQTGRD